MCNVLQEIDLNMYLEKGIGKVHSKWSPVSTAVYKFMPKIGSLTIIQLYTHGYVQLLVYIVLMFD